jgi:hypothetical protein
MYSQGARGIHGGCSGGEKKNLEHSKVKLVSSYFSEDKLVADVGCLGMQAYLPSLLSQRTS